MRKFLLWAAAVTFSFAAFLASCATQPESSHQKAPPAAGHKSGGNQSLAPAGFAARSPDQLAASLSR